MYILREGYNAIGTSIVTAHCILEMLSIYQFWSSWTELWGGSTCGSPAVLPWSAHYMELWASPLLSFLSFVFTAMSSRDIIALAIVDMFIRKTAILLTRSLLARIHLVPLKGPIQSRDSNIASAYCSLRLYISSPHWNNKKENNCHPIFTFPGQLTQKKGCRQRILSRRRPAGPR